MADEKASEVASSSGGGDSKSKPPILLLGLLVVNMAVVAGVGFMLWQNRKKEAAEPKIEQVIKGEHATQDDEHKDTKDIIGKVIPLETFVVNLSGSKGRRIVKVNMELELKGEQIQEEIDKRKAQIRDIIIILLSGKTYDEVSTRDGKENLRVEIKDTVNAFLTKGKIVNVYFTDLLYN